MDSSGIIRTGMPFGHQAETDPIQPGDIRLEFILNIMRCL